jgi:hypothetical protein
MSNRYYELLEELLQTVRENYLLRCINHHLKQKLKKYEQENTIYKVQE